MAEYMVRNWNAWHHHMALVMLSMLILLSYQIILKKMYKISLCGVILILKYCNPLRRIDAWEIARILRLFIIFWSPDFSQIIQTKNIYIYQK